MKYRLIWGLNVATGILAQTHLTVRLCFFLFQKWFAFKQLKQPNLYSVGNFVEIEALTEAEREWFSGPGWPLYPFLMLTGPHSRHSSKWELWFSRCGPQTSSISLPWELDTCTRSPAPPQTDWIRNSRTRAWNLNKPSRWCWCVFQCESHWPRVFKTNFDNS